MKLVKIQNTLIYLFAFSLVFENWNFMSIDGNSVPKMIGFLLILISLFDYKRTLNLQVFKSYLLPLFGFLGVILLSVLINYSGNTGWFGLLIQIVSNILLFWIFTNILYGRKQTINNMVLSLNIGILVMVILYLLGIGVLFDDEGRLSIFGENPNKIGLFSVICLLYIMTTIFEIKKKKKWYDFLPLLLLMPLLIIIANVGSRVTFMGLILTLSLFFLLKKNVNLFQKAVIILVGIGVMILVYNYFMSFEVLQTRMLRFYEDQDVSGRDKIWDIIIPEIISNPLLGLGINGYTDLISQIFSKFFSPHNVFIEVLIYSGIIGFIFFLLFLYEIFKTSYKIFHHKSYSYPLLVFIFFILVYLSGQGLAVKFMWIFYAFIVSTWHTSRIDSLRKIIIARK